MKVNIVHVVAANLQNNKMEIQMKKMICIGILCLASCTLTSPEECNLETDQVISGLCFEKKITYPVSEEEVSSIVSVLEEEVQKYYPQVTNLVQDFQDHRVKVFFFEVSLYMGCEEVRPDIFTCNKQVGGVNMNANEISLIWRDDCLSRTAIAHELMHSVQHHYDIPFDQNDPHASTPMFFVASTSHLDKIADKDKVNETVERRTLSRIQKDNCPSFKNTNHPGPLGL